MTMKRLLLLLCVLGACGGSDKQPAPAPVVSNVAPPAPPPTPPPAPPPPPTVEIAALPPTAPAECLAYIAIINSLMSCDKLPQETRDALQQGAIAMREGMVGAPPEALAALRDSCKAGAEGMEQARGSLGC
jgi:hypothetical protein